MMRDILISLVLYLCFLAFTGISSPKLNAQGGFASDNDILLQRFTGTSEPETKETNLLVPRGNRLVVRYNPVTLTFSGMMLVYQRYLSPQLPSECLYHPSCSSFSKSLISEYGMIKGIVATADRLIRCNRVAAIDIHPILFDEQRGKVGEQIDIYRREEK